MANPLPRRIFFWALVILFLIITPAVIFYTLGYRFNFKRGIFIYSGSVTIKSNPMDVKIILDNIDVSPKFISHLNDSYHVDGIKPGEHLIEVAAQGYKSWSKKITVSSGISTEFWNVVLPKENYEKQIIPLSNPKRFFLVPSKKLGAYTEQTENVFSVGMFDLDTLEKTPLYSTSEFNFTSDEKENIEWSPQAHRIIIPVEAKSDGAKHYIIVNVETKEVLDLSSLISEKNLRVVRWDQDRKNYIYYLSDNNLFRLDLENPNNKTIIASSVSSYDMTRNKIFYFQMPNGIIYSTGLDGKDTPTQITTSFPEPLSDQKKYKIIIYDEQRAAIIDNEKNLFIYNHGEKDTYFRKIGNNIDGAQFSDDGKKLLFWNKWEIFTYFTRSWNVQPIRNENDLIDITRYSQEISNVQWEKDYEHILFSVGNSIKIIELDNRGQRNTADVISFSEQTSAIVENLYNNQLFFTENNPDGTSGISVIDFPEKYGLFQ